MAATRTRRRQVFDIWPGFVDALATLLIIIIFTLMIFVVAQFYLTDALTGRDRALDRLNQEITRLSDLLSLEKTQSQQLETSLAEISAELQATLSARDALRAQVSELEGKAASLEGQIVGLTGQITGLEGKLADVETSAAGLRDEVTVLLAEIQALKAEREQLLSARESLTTERERLLGQTKTLTAERNRLADTTKTLTAERDRLAGATQTLTAERDRLAGATKTLTAEREQHIGKTAALTSERDRLIGKTEALTTERDRLIEDKKSLVVDRDDLKGRLASSIVKATKKDEELIKSRAALELLNRQIAAVRAQLAALEDALDAEEAKSKTREVEVEKLTKRLNVALARKVKDLERYRSEFFGRLREVLGTRSDIRIVGDRFVFQSEVLFASGSAVLGANGRAEIKKLADTLKTIAGRIPDEIDWVLRVDGHTDDRPIRTRAFPSNWELSTARSVSVVKFLIAQGIPARRLAATGFGQFQPIDPGKTAVALRKNRRIELKFDQR